MHSLAGSALPIITSRCFWELPTSVEVASSNESRQVSLALLAHLGRTNYVSRKANASILCLLLQCIAVFADRLGNAMEAYLPSICLAPCIEMATERLAPLVRVTAEYTLQRLAYSQTSGDEEGSIQQMVRDNIQSLLSTFVAHLRIHRGKAAPSPDEFEKIFTTLSMTKYVLDVIADKDVSADAQSPNHQSIRSLRELMAILVERYDHLLNQKVVSEPRRLEYAQTLGASLQYFCIECGVDQMKIYTYRLPGVAEPSKRPWLGLLDQFRVTSSTGLHSEEKYGEEEETRDDGPPNSINDTSFKQSPSADDVDFVDSVLSRCCFLLSNDSLRVRIAASEGMLSGFKYLSFLACQEVSFY